MRYEDIYKEGQVLQDGNGERFKITYVERILPREGKSFVVVSLKSLDRRGGKMEYPETLNTWKVISK